MNHGLTLYLSFPLFRLVSENLGRWVWALTLRVYEVFTKTGQGPWLRRDSALGPRCYNLCPTICIVLLHCFRERVATTFGALAGKLLTVGKQVPFGTTPKPCGLNLLEGGRRLALLEGFCFSMPGLFTLAGSGWQQGTER